MGDNFSVGVPVTRREGLTENNSSGICEEIQKPQNFTSEKTSSPVDPSGRLMGRTPDKNNMWWQIKKTLRYHKTEKQKHYTHNVKGAGRGV